METLFLDHGILTAFALFLGIFSLRSLVLAGGVQCWIRHNAWPRRHQIVPQEKLRTNIWRDISRGFQILAFDALIFAWLLHTGLFVADRTPSLTAEILTVVGFFVWFEIYFYFSHRALHHPRLFWIHRFHHEGRGTTPWTSIAFSFSERAILDLGAFLPAALISQWHPISLGAFGLYFLINYTLNVYGHMNVEIAPDWLRHSPLFRWLSTAVSHSLHHLRFRGHYGLFTRVLDVWFGTDFPDYAEVFDRVAKGKGAI